MRRNFFGTVRQKIFNWKVWYSLLCIKFPVTPNYLKHWRDAHKIFRHCETTNFCRKDVIHPVMHKIFRYPKFSETLDGCPRNFSALWDQKFSPEEHNNLYYTWNISIPQLLWNIERMLTENLGTVRQKTFSWKRRYPLLCIIFFVTPKLSESLKGCPQIFLALWDRNFSREKRDILYYTWNFSIPQLFWNVERMPTEILGTVRPKVFAKKTCYLL